MKTITRLSAYRQGRILERLRQDSFATVANLARELGCSEMTVRRDLKRLESERFLTRSYGGATATNRVKLEFALTEKSTSHAAEKTAIGRRAATLVKAGERIILDKGTTMLAMARELRSRDEISVVTTNLAIVAVLMPRREIECMLLGGIVREPSPDLYGPLLEDNLSRLHTDWAFIGCDGISIDKGLTADDARVIRATKLMISNSKRVVLLCDSSKAEGNSFISFAGIEDIDYLITDNKMPAKLLDAARSQDVETIVVDPEETATFINGRNGNDDR